MPPFRLAGGRSLRPLLFVTDPTRLRARVGSFADRCLDAIRSTGHALCDLEGEGRAEHAVAVVRGALRGAPVRGVVILGGPAVVPLRIVDTLPRPLRRTVAGAQDPDDFFVWSDDPYGDRNGDHIPDLPVTRVPDGGSARFMRRVLTVGQARRRSRSLAVRNVHRPFADAVYALLPLRRPMLVSRRATPRSIGSRALAGRQLYVMLHGSPFDGSRCWGEDAEGNPFLALTTRNIGSLADATVLSGACWGAMAWAPMARRALGGARITSRRPETSVALRCLASGARAFVGSTGANYSPVVRSWRSGSGPLHMAFWKHVLRGAAPARALWQAKSDYLRWIRSRTMTAEELAISFKVLREYTCLGIGW